MTPVKENCAHFDPDSGECAVLEELMCEKRGKCSFFSTECSAIRSYDRYCGIMSRKPKKVQRKAAKIYHGGKMPWIKKVKPLLKEDLNGQEIQEAVKVEKHYHSEGHGCTP